MVGRKSLTIEKTEIPSRSASSEVVRVENLNYVNPSGKKVLNNISFSLCKKNILGIAGVEGNGQKELCEILTGMRNCNSGNIEILKRPIKGKVSTSDPEDGSK